MMTRTGSGHDVVLVTAEAWEDHPLSPAGVIARVLDARGYGVGVVERPVTDADLARLGAPRLFFGVTSGSIDSMLNNYTPLKRRRASDPHGGGDPMPDRAVTVYCNRLRRLFKGVPLVIGGVEASLRRFAHYDYWENRVRRSVLLDTRAELLVYGSGERQVLEAADRLDAGRGLEGIEGTCTVAGDAPGRFELLPPAEEAARDPIAFCRMQAALSAEKDLAQPHGNRFVLQHRYPRYTPEDLDRVYSLPFSRELRSRSLLGMARFSVVTHRGCIGGCRFCSLALHQGGRIVSRSEASILAELESLARHPGFRGVVDDLGGPSANMYGMDCDRACGGDCLRCPRLERSHARLVALLRRAREVRGVRRVLVRSGVRYDLALESPEYLRELSRHHVPGCLKVAPEHVSPRVLALMNKPGERFAEFVRAFGRLNRGTGQALRYYFMVAHPGDGPGEARLLADRAARLGNVEQFQLFTPTPMTDSTCMYWTGLDPRTLEPVPVVRDYRTKKEMKRMMLDAVARANRAGAGANGPRAVPVARRRPA